MDKHDFVWYELKLIGSWKMWLSSEISNFQTHIKEKYLEHFLGIYPSLNETRAHQWLLNISSINGLVQLDNKPLLVFMKNH